MKVLVTGATGLVGRQVCLELLKHNHDLVVISSRDKKQFQQSFTYPCEYLHWSQLDQLPTCDAVIHLAGENISSGRWTESKKTSILESRTEPTQKLIEAFRDNNQWPSVFVSTSAIGYYGDRGSEFLNEDSKKGHGFLSDVCEAWEESAKLAQNNCRLVVLRVGVVLDSTGGFLQKMEPLFTSQLGGKIGSGKQWMSWVHIDDLVQLYVTSLTNTKMQGTYNAVAPVPVTNAHFTQSYANQLGSWKLFTAPKVALKIAMGEMSEIALASQNVLSEKVKAAGYEFQHQNIEEALADLYSWKKSPNQQKFFATQWVSQPPEKVFPFFSDAQNLEKITPPFLNFKVLNTSDDPIREGTVINYKLKIHGFPANWQTRIESWKPNSRFVDDQVKGPYKKWHHTHSFEPLKSGTLLKDEVIYELPLKKLGYWTASHFVEKDVQRIFNYRKKIIQKMDGQF